MIDYNLLKHQTKEKKFQIALELYRSGEIYDAMATVGLIVDDYPDDYESIYLYGACLQDSDKFGFAELMFKRCTEIDPSRHDGWMARGTAIKSPQRSDEAIGYLMNAIQIKPDSAASMANAATVYNEIGKYSLAEKYARKAIELGGGMASHDTLGISLLGQEKYGEGFKEITHSLGSKYRKEFVYGDEERWEGEKGKAVIIYGEQGIGDEIFYGSVIPDAIKDCKKVIIDCDPRLENLFKRSFSKASVYGTRNKAAEWPNHHKWDARCSMASLSEFYRKERDSYSGEPFLIPDPVRTQQWSHTFSNNTKIGLAWNGGTRNTGYEFRKIPLDAFSPFYRMGECISLEYHKSDTKGYPIKWYEHATITDDYDNTAALVANLDYVVTTCTSIVHLAGGLGIPCFVLKNPYVSWRYANDMPQYNSVRLIDWKGSWNKGIEEVIKLIKLRKVA